MPDLLAGPFIRSVELLPEKVDSFARYPFSIPAVRELGRLELHPKVTYLIGENGSGKSTLIEAIAVAAGFNPEGGSKNFRFATRRSESELHSAIQAVRGPIREEDGFFLRAESFFNVGTEIENLDREGGAGRPLIQSYGGRSLHEQSHGESFMALVNNRFGEKGLYILDEPEAALSPSRQLALLRAIHDLVASHSQFIIATHSPIIMAYPDSRIYELSVDGIRHIPYERTEHYQITKDFLNRTEAYLHHLFADRDYEEDGE